MVHLGWACPSRFISYKRFGREGGGVPHAAEKSYGSYNSVLVTSYLLIQSNGKTGLNFELEVLTLLLYLNAAAEMDNCLTGT